MFIGLEHFTLRVDAKHLYIRVLSASAYIGREDYCSGYHHMVNLRLVFKTVSR